MCEATTIYCNWQNLTAVPAGLEFGADTNMLNLDYNAITAFPAAAVGAAPTAVSSLVLSHNAITALAADALTAFPRLEFFLADRNALTELPAGLFAATPRLVFLSLSGNRFTRLPLLMPAPPLRNFVCNYNPLQTLERGRLAPVCGALVQLSIQGDPTAARVSPAVDADLLADCRALTTLDLGGQKPGPLPAAFFDAPAATLSTALLDVRRACWAA